jgi:hypothetical protein
MTEPDHIAAQEHSSCHRRELAASESCGCFYCLSIFEPVEIERWVDKGGTALCPRCGIDSVIGSASGYPITRDFLERMHRKWFGTPPG